MATNGGKKIKILVTGGSGFIGGILIKKLLKEKCDIVALQNNRKIDLPVKIVKANILDKNIKKYFADIDVVIHCAAYMGSLKDKNGENFLKVNVNGTKNIWGFIDHKKTKFIFISSVAAIEKNIKNDWYAKSKFLATEFIKKQKNKNWAIIYPTAVVDFDKVGGKIPGFLMSRIGNKNRMINFVDVNNLTEAIVKIALNRKLNGNYVLGGVNISVDNYLKKMGVLSFRLPQGLIKLAVRMVMGRNNLYNILDKKFDSQKFYSKKAVKDFGYNPNKNLEKIL